MGGVSVLVGADFWSYSVTVAAAIAILAIALDLQLAGGTLALSPIAFAATGAYGAGIAQAEGAPTWVAALVGVAAAAALAGLLAGPLLWARPEIVALATVAVAESIRQIIIASAPGGVTGGADGRPVTVGEWVELDRDATGWLADQGVDLGRFAPLAILAWAVAFLVWGVARRLRRSGWGAALDAAREIPSVAEAFGARPGLRRLQSLVAGATLCALAGELLVLLDDGVSPARAAVDASVGALAIVLATRLWGRALLPLAAVGVAVALSLARLDGLPGSDATLHGTGILMLGALAAGLAVWRGGRAPGGSDG